MIHDTSIILISHDPLILVMIHDTVSYPRVPYHTGTVRRGGFTVYTTVPGKGLQRTTVPPMYLDVYTTTTVLLLRVYFLD